VPWALTKMRSSTARSGCSSASRSAHSRWCKTSWPKWLANITASQCLLVRMSQLEAEGKMTDAHASLAKAFTTANVARRSRGRVSCSAATASPLSTTSGWFFVDAEALYSYEGTFQMQEPDSRQDHYRPQRFHLARLEHFCRNDVHK